VGDKDGLVVQDHLQATKPDHPLRRPRFLEDRAHADPPQAQRGTSSGPWLDRFAGQDKRWYERCKM